MANQLLFSTDFSPASEPAFAKAMELTKLLGAELTIAHILHFPPMAGSAFMPVTEETEDAMRKWCADRLGELAAKAQTSGVKAQTALREDPHAHEGIVALAKQLKPVMIILGTHGRTGLSKLVLGSVAARVITAAPCPVLTVRAA